MRLEEWHHSKGVCVCVWGGWDGGTVWAAWTNSLKPHGALFSSQKWSNIRYWEHKDERIWVELEEADHIKSLTFKSNRGHCWILECVHICVYACVYVYIYIHVYHIIHQALPWKSWILKANIPPYIALKQNEKLRKTNKYST